MSKRQLIVKVSSLQESITRFKTIWKKAARGEHMETPIEIISFSSTEVLSPNRQFFRDIFSSPSV